MIFSAEHLQEHSLVAPIARWESTLSVTCQQWEQCFSNLFSKIFCCKCEAALPFQITVSLCLEQGCEGAAALSFTENLLIILAKGWCKIFQASSHQGDAILEAFMLLEQLDNRKLSTDFLSSWELTSGVRDHSFWI